MQDENHPIVRALLNIPNIEFKPFIFACQASRRKWDDHIAILGAYAFLLGFVIRNLQIKRPLTTLKAHPSAQNPLIVYRGIPMNEFEINQFKEAFADSHEINIPGFQRCMVDKEKARGYAKPVGATKPQRFGVLLVIRWESPHDYLILDDPRHYE